MTENDTVGIEQHYYRVALHAIEQLASEKRARISAPVIAMRVVIGLRKHRCIEPPLTRWQHFLCAIKPRRKL